jgi:hypothetical protein
MRGKIARFAAKAAVLIAVLLTLGLFSSVAKAQLGYQGKVTLPYEVHWGKAVLEPGTYLLTFVNDTRQMLVIRNAESQWFVAFEGSDIWEDSGTGGSALLIGMRGDQRIVHSFRIAELGETFVYDPALAHPHAVDNASNTRAIPVLVAKR